jgi:acetamidase/formamidase
VHRASLHHLESAASHFGWDNSIEPVLEIESGEDVELEVRDASGGQLDRDSGPAEVAALDFERVNPVTGPVFVKGAERDDVLAIEILELRPRDWGWTALIPGFGLLAEEFPAPWLRISEVDAAADRVRFGGGVVLPYEPFPGTIGVAPPDPGPHSIVPPRKWGGNMDTKHLRAGTTLLLPVGVEGALFSVGDTHAAQGDGEVCGTAIECPTSARLTLDLRDDLPLEWPCARIDGAWLTFGFDEHLGFAAKKAVDGMIALMAREHGLPRAQAISLASVVVDLRVTQVVNAQLGVHAVLRDDAWR